MSNTKMIIQISWCFNLCRHRFFPAAKRTFNKPTSIILLFSQNVTIAKLLFFSNLLKSICDYPQTPTISIQKLKASSPKLFIYYWKVILVRGKFFVYFFVSSSDSNPNRPHISFVAAHHFANYRLNRHCRLRLPFRVSHRCLSGNSGLVSDRRRLVFNRLNILGCSVNFRCYRQNLAGNIKTYTHWWTCTSWPRWTWTRRLSLPLFLFEKIDS